MNDHRVRLSEREVQLIVSALFARRAGVGTETEQACLRLAKRLHHMNVGNPNWVHKNEFIKARLAPR